MLLFDGGKKPSLLSVLCQPAVDDTFNASDGVGLAASKWPIQRRPVGPANYDSPFSPYDSHQEGELHTFVLHNCCVSFAGPTPLYHGKYRRFHEII